MRRDKFSRGDVVELTTDAISSIEGRFMKRFFGQKLYVADEKTDSAHNTEGYALADDTGTVIRRGGEPFIFISADMKKVGKVSNKRSKRSNR
jgi:hypothetical protein